MKSKISRIFTFLGSLMLIALLFSFISWFLNGGLNTFSVGYDDTIFTKDTENVSIIESGTFTVHYKDEDTNAYFFAFATRADYGFNKLIFGFSVSNEHT